MHGVRDLHEQNRDIVERLARVSEIRLVEQILGGAFEALTHCSSMLRWCMSAQSTWPPSASV